MQNSSKRKRTIMITAIILSCLLTAIFEFVSISPFKQTIYNKLLQNILPLPFATLSVLLLARTCGYKLFFRPQKLFCLLPCLLIAIDNFPFASYFAGKLELKYAQPLAFFGFAVYCLFVGLFEEILFRGILFGVLTERFSKDKKGLLKSYMLSSLIFGLMHLLNLFTGASIGATLLQACYSILTGGLFAYAFLKSKNILIPALVHAVYNCCGLLFTAELGLGYGSLIDLPTALTMLCVCSLVGCFVVYQVLTYPERERTELYVRLGVSKKN